MHTINQAVLFTKPIHHLDLSITATALNEQVCAYLEEVGVRIVRTRNIGGSELAERGIIRRHYQMYSRGACVQHADELALTVEAKAQFESCFGQPWDEAKEAVLGSPLLQQRMGISSHELFLLWNEQWEQGKTCRLQEGVIVAPLAELNGYCVNAFYPAMEENFYHPSTDMYYHVVEFDPAQHTWVDFRKRLLGATDAGRAGPDTLRGRLYAAHPVCYPGRDNFVHGSAGPLEGLVERMIHESDFDMATHPLGRGLIEQGTSIEAFTRWMEHAPLRELGSVFDATEEKDTSEVLDLLKNFSFSPTP